MTVARGLRRTGALALGVVSVALAEAARRIARAVAALGRAVIRGAVLIAAAAQAVAAVAMAAVGLAGRFTLRCARRIPLGGRRLWLALGIPIAGLAGLSSIASISLLPPSMHTTSIAFAVASSEMSVQTPTSSGNTPELRNLFPLPQWAAVLADELTSPGLKAQIARQAKIPVGQLAIDGPIALNLQRTQQEPTEEKRSFQLLSEADPYRITLDTDPNVAGVTITAQARASPGRDSSSTRSTALRLTTSPALRTPRTCRPPIASRPRSFSRS